MDSLILIIQWHDDHKPNISYSLCQKKSVGMLLLVKEKTKFSSPPRSMHSTGLWRAIRTKRFFRSFYLFIYLLIYLFIYFGSCKSRPHYWLLTIHCRRLYSVFNKLSFNFGVQQNNWPQKEDKWKGYPEFMMKIHFPVSL